MRFYIFIETNWWLDLSKITYMLLRFLNLELYSKSLRGIISELVVIIGIFIWTDVNRWIFVYTEHMPSFGLLFSIFFHVKQLLHAWKGFIVATLSMLIDFVICYRLIYLDWFSSSFIYFMYFFKIIWIFLPVSHSPVLPPHWCGALKAPVGTDNYNSVKRYILHMLASYCRFLVFWNKFIQCLKILSIYLLLHWWQAWHFLAYLSPSVGNVLVIIMCMYHPTIKVIYLTATLFDGCSGVICLYHVICLL